MKRLKTLTKTERLLLFLEAVALILSALTVYVILSGKGDAYQMGVLTLAWIAETAHFHALYARKESRANSQKYMQEWVEKAADKYTPEIAARYAEIVLQNSNQ